MARSITTLASRMVLEGELLSLLLQGFSVRECSGMLHCGTNTLLRVAKDPEFLLKVQEKSKECAERVSEEVSKGQIAFAKRLEEASEQALDEMISLMNELDGQPKLKIHVCQDLLDRDVRASRKTQQKHEVTHDFINPAVLMHAAVTARELQQFQETKQLGNPSDSASTGTPVAGHPSDSGVGQGGGPVEGAPSEG